MIRKNISTVYGPQKVAVPCIEEINTEDGKTETEEEVQIEVSVHSVSSTSYIRELREVFPTWTISSSATVITTMQNAAIDLVGIGSQLSEEKDILLERFVLVAKKLCAALEKEGYSADFIDPCSGLPGICLDGNIVFNEVQSAQILLGYKVMNVGCCKVIMHPEWGSAVYPASMVTLAPADIVVRCVEDVCRS